MQRLSAVALLVLLCWQMSGWHVLHPLNRKLVSQLLKRHVTEHRLTVLVFSNADLHLLQWVEKGKEFVLNGKWYDVAHTEVCGNLTYFHCFADETDTQLSAHHYGTDNPENGPQNQQANQLKFASVVYCNAVNRLLFCPPPALTALAQSTLSLPLPPLPVIDVPTPPPQTKTGKI
ncbi:hypothetical protein C7N43_34415 [Sphingobacteriales bacterium UPWRP_1]|nr:hypothetical protein BVG80_15515 [Sphingobacteriales bacterium TSM_CSM]PSJ72407.1 hypothetical protein C7N43_34415 [Sphingobacteriales bacterium UPWRP_1]